MSLKELFVSIAILFFIQGSFAQEGWDKSKEDNALVYIPSGLKEGKEFRLTILSSMNLKGQDLEEWFISESKMQQSKLGKPLKPWQVKPQKNETWGVANMFVNAMGEKMSVGYQGGTFNNGRVYILQMVSSLDPEIIMKYGVDMDKVLKNAESTYENNPSLTAVASSSMRKKDTSTSSKPYKPKKETKLSGKDKRLAIERAIRTTPGNGVKSSEIEDIWVNSYIDVLWGGIDVDTYVLFKNGTAYKDCEIPPNELLVSKSKELQPKKWTVWRKSGSGYQIKNVKDGTWNKLEGNKAIKTKSNEKLMVKFITAGGSQTAGAWKNSITFKPNGRFELTNFSMNNNDMLGGGDTGPSVSMIHKSDKEGTSGTTVVSGGNVGGGTASKKNDGSKNTGTYYLNGYTITLKHDNGYQHTELFFFDETDKESFIYKDTKYWLDED